MIDRPPLVQGRHKSSERHASVQGRLIRTGAKPVGWVCNPVTPRCRYASEWRAGALALKYARWRLDGVLNDEKPMTPREAQVNVPGSLVFEEISGRFLESRPTLRVRLRRMQ